MPFYILHPKDVSAVQKQKRAMVIDIRENGEFRSYHYKNAVNLPYSETESWYQHFHRGQTYILYCDYGNVSLLAARNLSKRGITAYTVLGGAKELKSYR